jgi:outer membrane protein assembly factor BamB
LAENYEWLRVPRAGFRTLARIGDLSGTLHAINTETGDLLWDYELDGNLGRDGLAVVDGVPYVADRDGSIYAITGADR